MNRRPLLDYFKPHSKVFATTYPTRKKARPDVPDRQFESRSPPKSIASLKCPPDYVIVMKRSIIMLNLLLNYSLVLFGLFSAVPAFPTAPPLNERNKEVSWEAWLLVDDQNQNRPVELETPRRRIVPKSIFFTQTFSPENLPPCEEGHSRDANGMCVKVIKLDKANHLDFLLEKLKEKFGTLADYDTELDPNSEPTRVDIPFDGDYGDYANNDNLQEELDMAIIVTPTTREIEASGDDSKVGKRDDTYEEQLKMLKAGSTTESATTTEVVETTTNQVESDETTTTTTTTSQDEITEQSTLLVGESTSTESTTTVTEQPDTTTTTTPKITTYHPVATTYHPYIGLDWMTKTKNLVSFPVEDAPMPRSHPSRHLVRFPDVDAKVQQESQGHHTRDVNNQAGNFFNEIVTPQPSERVQDVVLPPRGHVAGFYDNHKFATTEKHSMKKPKQSLFALPPDWSPQDPKPIVLRFSRKHLHFITNKFKNGEFYRSLPVEDLTYLFGYKNGQSRQHR